MPLDGGGTDLTFLPGSSTIGLVGSEGKLEAREGERELFVLKRASKGSSPGWKFATLRLRGPVMQVRILSMLLFALVAAVASAEPPAKTALDDYVAKPDGSYRWKLAKTVPGNGFTTYVVDLTSQTWRTKSDVNRTEWRHWLVVVKPDGVEADTALLYVGGGSNDDGMPGGAGGQIRTLAMASRSVVAELRMVPNQPLEFRGDGQPRFEDDLVGYTWDKFLTTADETWLARLPMVKSVVRAMDTVQALLAGRDRGGLKIEKFVVAGASKRGWTTWLTGAVDRRVVAIIPIVIDVLNVRLSMNHHHAAYGFWAPAVGDYVRHRVMDRMDSPECDALMKIADPYAYRHRLALPKFLVNAAGDQFFLPDSSQFYFDDLPGEKYLRYVPNTDHSLKDSDALESILAYYRAILTKTPRPKFSWEHRPDGSLHVSTETRPQSVLLWQATATESRDFRLEKIGPAYTSSPLEDRGNGRYVAKVAAPKKGWTAFFVELAFDGHGGQPLKFTTSVYVVPDVLPHQEKPTAGLGQ